MTTLSRPRMRAATPFALLALGALALASTPGALSAQVTQEQTGTLTGLVLDQASGQAIPDVIVLVQGTEVGTSTGADGRFRMILPAGSHTLIVRHLAYGCLLYTSPSPRDS